MTTDDQTQTVAAPPKRPSIPAARIAANATRRATAPSVQLLSPSGTPLDSVVAREPVAADPRYGPSGTRARPVTAYDAGLPPPPLPPDASGAALQFLDVEDTLAAVHRRLTPALRLSRQDQQILARRCRRILHWLAGFPGATWEERWLASGADAAPAGWVDAVLPDRTHRWEQHAVSGGAYALMQARVLRPSYAWLLGSARVANGLLRVLRVDDPASLAALRALPAYARALPRHRVDAEHALARVVIRTGRSLTALTGAELLHYADVVKTTGRNRREHLAWELLAELGALAGEPATLRAAWSAKGNSRQIPVAVLVDRYGVGPGGVRDLLVDYLGELAPGMDFGSLVGLAYRLVRLFWWEVLQINPAQADLRLSPRTVTAWRERFALTTDGRPRRETHSTLFAVRGLYRDLAEWGHEDPVRWGVWVAACPVPRSQSHAAAKQKRHQKARTQARTRTLTPLFPAFVTASVERRDWGARLLAAATAVPSDGEELVVDGVRYARRKTGPHAGHRNPPYLLPSLVWAEIIAVNPGARPVPLERGLVNVSRHEDDAFWAWAVTETLRHTGVRIEELLELTQLSLRHYTAPTTNTLVPLLHITPSKTDAERLIPMSPELVQVLLAVLRRAKGTVPDGTAGNGPGQVPLSVRYDPHERVHGEPMPHLFARRLGTRQEVLSGGYVRTLLNGTAAWAGLRDAGEPVRFTPHDFRRLFTTELVGAGLPLHIAASLLGHLDLDTTRGYTAVFPEHLITAHQAFIERRRTTRPDGELRSATADEWADFEQHFLQRTVALGSCHRPYATPCVHEHACTRCRFLRVDPAQLGRIEDMTTNTEARLTEARDKVWLGEVTALEETLTHLRRRRDEAEQRRDQQRLEATGQPAEFSQATRRTSARSPTRRRQAERDQRGRGLARPAAAVRRRAHRARSPTACTSARLHKTRLRRRAHPTG